MGKGKKRGKSRKQRSIENQKFRNMPADQLISKGDAYIKKLNIRDAITAYKQAGVNKGSLDIVMPKLFHAYSLRYGQLNDQKMVKEADAVLSMAGNIFSNLPVVTPGVLKDCILFFPVQKSFEIYKKYIKTNDPLLEIEKKLGNWLVAEDSLFLVQDLDDGSRLRRDLDYIQNAVTKMQTGDWEKALNEMRPVPRNSPYFDMKVFAKAMVSYLNGDRTSLGKALCMLKEDFPFSGVPILLREYAAKAKFESHGKYPGAAGLLMGENIHKQTYQSNLEKAVGSGDIKNINKWSKSLSQILLPDNPEKALVSILELIGSGKNQLEMSNEIYRELLKSNIPCEKQRNMLFVKIMGANVNFLSFYTVQYLNRIEEEFPGKKERQIAKSIVLMEIVKALNHDSDFVDDYEEELEDIFAFFDIPGDVIDEDFEEIVFQITKKAIDLDPENREACDILLDLSMESPGMRKSLEPSLLKMVEVFKKDHLACLKLAELYYLKNAVRKAENILLQAYKRAPHDLQVQEKYALSFIIAGVRNLKRKKWGIVSRDFAKAEKFNVNSLKIVIAEKKLLFHGVKTNKFSRKMFETITQGFSLHESMKLLLLFKLDLEDPDGVKPYNVRGLASLFNFFKKKEGTLLSNELYSLLKPIKETFGLLFWKPFFALPLLGKKGKILSRLNNDDFINLIVDLVQNDCMEMVIKELEKRRKIAQAELLVIFDFYYTALCHIQGTMSEPQLLDDIIDRADEPLRERLRGISRNLSTLAPIYMKKAFNTFDFQRIGSSCFYEDDFYEDDFDEDDFDEDMMLDGIPDGMYAVISDILSDMVSDEMPDGKKIKEVIDKFFKKNLQKDSQTYLTNCDVKNMFGQNCDEEIIDVVENLVESADLLVSAPLESLGNAFANEFISDFSELISLIKKTGSKSAGEYKQIGRKFATELESAKTIIQALDMCKKRMPGLSAPETKHFIMGMRTGI